MEILLEYALGELEKSRDLSVLVHCLNPYSIGICSVR